MLPSPIGLSAWGIQRVRLPSLTITPLSHKSDTYNTTPADSISMDIRPPLGEAHGGYTFCATASWILLQPYIRTYYVDTNKPKPNINTSSLLRWLTHMQGTDIELGGFKGRTNKLVDGCYSWWVGGCVVLVEGLLGIGDQRNQAIDETKKQQEKAGDDDVWDDVDGE